MQNSTPLRLPGEVRCDTHTITSLMVQLRGWRETSNPANRSILCVNAHIVNLAYDDDALRANLEAAGVVTADGMSIVWASKSLKPEIEQRCNMTDALRVFLKADFPPGRAILIGGTEDQAKRAAASMTRASAHLDVTEVIDGYLSTDEIEERLDEFQQEASFDYILVGLGTPRSEEAVIRFARRWPKTIVWHVGGGTILFHAGDKTEAPAWMRKSGLQWAHRLILEPRRMWKRYLVGNSVFVWRVMRLAMRKS